MNILNKAVLISVFIIMGGALQAEVTSAQEAVDSVGSIDCSPRTDLGKDSKFPEIRKLALDLDTKLCRSLLTMDEDNPEEVLAIVEFGQASEEWLKKAFKSDTKIVTAIDSQFDLFESHVINFQGSVKNFKLPKLETGLSPNLKKVLYFSPYKPATGSIHTSNSDTCNNIGGTDSFETCKGALMAASNVFNIYRKSVAEDLPKKNKSKLKYINDKWDKYLSKARSQTFLDVWFTTVIHDNYYSQNHLVGPADTQYFLLRPQIVYEHSKKITKGERDRVGLAAEWVGINFWDWKVPLGLSAVSIYSDYEEESSVGHGLLLTIKNSASIGYVKRGDSEGVFVTLDFLKLWQDKSDKLKEYKKDPWAWFK